ncbi:hypothetical protein OG883_24240 [Streptomyces sp. NBC_01142]|uniref:hypothetical protein n=1 Tax=Streptomyces sp. NBC_01142 TaxID=2975865 RepID=UPI0022546B4F|nr:hypothetical protein [Streptomyces sp. NBC_01142]MCX4822943.1 hypothetical protein [Streptomyces sp. NBC_01142]
MALLAFNSPCGTARLRTWQARLLTGAGLALLPWMGFLAATLPPGRAAAWVALDSLEAACLLTAGTRLARGGGGHRVAAAGAALLLAADACADVLTSAPGTELAAAVAMAVCAELPLAGLCAFLAVRAHPEDGPAHAQAVRAHAKDGPAHAKAGRAPGPAGL